MIVTDDEPRISSLCIVLYILQKNDRLYMPFAHFVGSWLHVLVRSKGVHKSTSNWNRPFSLHPPFLFPSGSSSFSDVLILILLGSSGAIFLATDPEIIGAIRANFSSIHQ